MAPVIFSAQISYSEEFALILLVKFLSRTQLPVAPADLSPTHLATGLLPVTAPGCYGATPDNILDVSAPEGDEHEWWVGNFHLRLALQLRSSFFLVAPKFCDKAPSSG